MHFEETKSLSQAIREAVRAHVERKKIERFMALAGSRLSDYDWRKAEEEELRESLSR
jgi:hypothetical protein